MPGDTGSNSLPHKPDSCAESTLRGVEHIFRKCQHCLTSGDKRSQLVRYFMVPQENTTISTVYGRPLLQLARELGVHIATAHRWRDPGVLDRAGVRRRLRMV